MTAYMVVCTTALLASTLTLFSGFGLGTLLMPALVIFFPVPVAVGMTAMVHLLNNILKVATFGHHADFKTAVKFGLPAALAAYFGAWCLSGFSHQSPLVVYSFFHKQAEITWLKLLMALIMAGFAALEIHPRYKDLSFDPKHMPLGGLLSGFFGGLSGNQGALRSAFLIRAGLSRESFIGTGIIIACFVDFTRLIVYTSKFQGAIRQDVLPLMLAATASAFAGVWLGSRFFKKVTLAKIQSLVSILLFIIALGLASGII